jgi:hypothetical protein
VLLDGAGTFGPLLDNDKKIYNLDHHWGCERLFTLSTCEQALLLVHSGLRLSEGDWTLYANDPDLDTVLALWCLLNHRRLRELRPEARDVLLPLLRLEGAIDANGPELARLCGLPAAVMVETERRIDELLVRERELKQAGAWAKKDVYAYTAEILRAVDAMVYLDEDFGDYTRVEEIYGHVEVAPRCVAVVCRDRSGIYTVEQHLAHGGAARPELGHVDGQRVERERLGPVVREAHAAELERGLQAVAQLGRLRRVELEGQPAVDALGQGLDPERAEGRGQRPQPQARELDVERELGLLGLGVPVAAHAQEVEHLRRGRHHDEARGPAGRADVGGADRHGQHGVDRRRDGLVAHAHRDVLHPRGDHLERRLE